MKFGGTSVGSAEQIRRVGKIIADRRERSPVVVVSAVGGITDRLWKLARLAVDPESSAAAEALLAEIVRVHTDILEEVELPQDLLDDLFGEFRDLVRGISLIREVTERTHDYLVSFGERLSSRIVSGHLTKVGTPSRAFDAFAVGLITDGRFGAARPLDDVDDRIREHLGGLKVVPVITGYIGRNESGEITTLGRGGSDYSASIFGAALGAEEIQIWTDVDGVMTCDPRLDPNATYLEKLSFAEASELAFYGAKVIHPQTMIPAIRKSIPIRVLNTNRPEFGGTLIVDQLDDSERYVKSISVKDHVAVVNVIAAPMLNQYGFLAKIADVFTKYEVVIDMIATSEVSVSMTTDQSVDLDPVINDLAKFSEVRVDRDKAIVSVVGERLQEAEGFAARVFDTVRDVGARVDMISYGATRLNLSFLISSARSPEVVKALHQKLFLTKE